MGKVAKIRMLRCKDKYYDYHRFYFFNKIIRKFRKTWKKLREGEIEEGGSKV